MMTIADASSNLVP